LPKPIAIVAHPNLLTIPLDFDPLILMATVQSLARAVALGRNGVRGALGAEDFAALATVVPPIEEREGRVALVTVLALLVIDPETLLCPAVLPTLVLRVANARLEDFLEPFP
jgi:ABC-type uncharacterized transport system YnjBCD permease subunit